MKPVPWFWIVRLALSGGAVFAWGQTHPQAGVIQLAVVCLVVIAGLEGLRLGYRYEQDQITRRRAR